MYFIRGLIIFQLIKVGHPEKAKPYPMISIHTIQKSACHSLVVLFWLASSTADKDIWKFKLIVIQISIPLYQQIQLSSD